MKGKALLLLLTSVLILGARQPIMAQDKPKLAGASQPVMAQDKPKAVGASQQPVMAQGKPKPAAAQPPLRVLSGADQARPALASHPDVARGLDDVTPSQKVVQALQAMHMVECAATVQRITDFLFAGQDANFVAQPLGPDNVRWPTVFAIESADPAGGHSRFALLMIAGNCSGMYEQTLYWPNPCNVVKSQVFGKYTGEHPLLRDYRSSADGPAREVFLTPAGPGCISIKKELFH